MLKNHSSVSVILSSSEKTPTEELNKQQAVASLAMEIKPNQLAFYDMKLILKFFIKI